MAIGRKLNVSHPSLYSWQDAWESKGLVSGHTDGRPLAMREDMIATAVTIASQEALCLKGIAERVEAAYQCKLPCTLEKLRKMLKWQGFGFKRMRMSLNKQRPRQICRQKGRTYWFESLGARRRLLGILLR
jgi:transposase